MIPGKILKKALWLLPALLAVPALFASAALTGQQIYDQNCAGCHRLGTYDTSGSAIDLLGMGSNVTSLFSQGASHNGITLTATDTASLAAFVNNPTPAPAPVSVTTSSLSNGTVGNAYSQTLAATGGTTPYSWSVSSGSLPAGLTLSTTGVISGTPTNAATFSFTAKVTDSAATPATATKSLSITVAASTPAASPVSITTTSLANGTAGTAYSQTLAATGGVPPYSWSYSGTLPSGLGLTSAGTLAGTPTTAGTYSFTARVTDSKATAATQALSLTIAAAAATPMTSADKNLFINNCLNCHTPTGVQNSTASQISSAINGNVGSMGTTQLKSLSSTDLNNIATSLVPTPLPAWNCTTCHGSTTPTSGGSTSGSGTTTSTDGATLYATYCASCHGPLATSNKLGTTATLIQTGISQNIGGMGTPTLQALTITQIQAMAAALNPTSTSGTGTTLSTGTSGTGTTALTASQAAGKTIYDSKCAGCHALGAYDTTGSPNLSGFSSAVGTVFGGGQNHNGITLSATDITNVAAFIALY